MQCATGEGMLQHANVFQTISEILMLLADLSVSLMRIAPRISSVGINIALILALDYVVQMLTAKWLITFPYVSVTKAI